MQRHPRGDPVSMAQADYYYDECFPHRLFTLKEIKHQYQSLLDMVPSDERTFEEYLFDNHYRNGGSLYPVHDKEKM